MQRLFSTFADGFPGVALLLQRVLAGAVVLDRAIVHVLQRPYALPGIPHMIGAAAAVLLLLGVWTPISGSMVAMVAVWALITGTADPWIPIMVATLGATLAMIGPGAWSIDALMYGRKHIETRDYQRKSD